MFSSWFDVLGSAVELAMETSRVDSVVCNQAMAKVEPADDEDQLQALKSKWISADEAKRKKLKRRRIENQQMKRSARGEATSYGNSAGCYLELAMAKRCRLHKLVRQRFDFAHIIQQDGSYNDEFSRMIFAKRFSRREESAVARFSRKIQQKRKRSSSRLESAGAKQLTTYEELRELDVNC
ncbi:cyclic nucleotide-gated ion channel 1-like [Dorcoceras hygrometricum]|uniref:Cyclic nucleotide-gated ion channel 1-like n=1 Tax=Dorcoceras hygrometricum TaxID=472368 RepID=A0A2Z7BDV1_9LAMI|nr:cyclic nucleotide-gated ion channel 1-like [Dorcoceras hygrometricum]